MGAGGARAQEPPAPPPHPHRLLLSSRSSSSSSSRSRSSSTVGASSGGRRRRVSKINCSVRSSSRSSSNQGGTWGEGGLRGAVLCAWAWRGSRHSTGPGSRETQNGVAEAGTRNMACVWGGGIAAAFALHLRVFCARGFGIAGGPVRACHLGEGGAKRCMPQTETWTREIAARPQRTPSSGRSDACTLPRWSIWRMRGGDLFGAFVAKLGGSFLQYAYRML